jgi:hypothetical protein
VAAGRFPLTGRARNCCIFDTPACRIHIESRIVWNRSESLERRAIERFLREVNEHIDRIPERLPFRPELGKLVVAWARGLLDLKPSEMCSGP